MNGYVMPFYRNRVYPLLVHSLGDPPPIQTVRRQIIPRALGTVLEIGVGTGANYSHYDSTRIQKFYALEPNPGMLRIAQRQQRRTKLNIEYLNLAGEHLPLDSSTVDTVVSTFTLCTIADIAEALRALHRVLRPTGQLIFLELGLAPDGRVQRWQRRVEPLFHWLFDGLYLTRDIPSLLSQAGFVIDHLEAGYLARFPRSPSYCWWGTASRGSALSTRPRFVLF
jgi:SAM-dependent methyltransferase